MTRFIYFVLYKTEDRNFWQIRIFARFFIGVWLFFFLDSEFLFGIILKYLFIRLSINGETLPKYVYDVVLCMYGNLIFHKLIQYAYEFNHIFFINIFDFFIS